MSDASLVIGCFACRRKLFLSSGASLSSEAVHSGTVTELASLASRPFLNHTCHWVLVFNDRCSSYHRMLVLSSDAVPVIRSFFLSSEASHSGTITELASRPFGPGPLFDHSHRGVLLCDVRCFSCHRMLSLSSGAVLVIGCFFCHQGLCIVVLSRISLR